MATKHTPGPWRWSEAEGAIESHGEVAMLLARPWRSDEHLFPEDVPNMRLMAAAPAMREALYRVRNFLACSGTALANSHAMTIIEDALALAK